MKVRIKFSKSGPLKFIGHLDVMRYFQKAFRRAEIDVEYSKGFSPHQLMSFAAPLGVGLTSSGEYLDVSMNSVEAPDIMIKKINKAMDEDLKITGFTILPEDSKNAMSIVAAADYLLFVKDGYDFMVNPEFMNRFQEFMNRESIVITKKSKKSEKEADIRPMIYDYGFRAEGFPSDKTYQTILEEDARAKVYLKLATGSASNLKPELVMEAFCQFAGIPYNPFTYQVHRLEVYKEGKENSSIFLPLDAVDA